MGNVRFESFASRVEAAFSSWTEVKLLIEHSLSISRESLHVVIGVLILLASALLLRKPLSSWAPWFAVMAFTLINEAVDLWVDQWPQPSMQFGEGINDLLVTMFLPTLFLLAVRKAPRLFEARSRAEPESSGADTAGR